MRLGIFVPNINQGGTERVTAILANEFKKSGLDVVLITLGNKPFPFKCEAKHVVLDEKFRKGKLTRFFYRLFRLKFFIRLYKLEIILSMGEYSNFMTSFLPKDIKKVIRVTNSLSRINGISAYKMRFLFKIASEKSDIIVLPTKDLEIELGNKTNARSKLKVIANPIASTWMLVTKNKKRRQEYNYWLHIGQFVTQKNHLGLLRIYQKYLMKSKKKSKLVLIGTGELENQIKDYAERLQVCEYVEFLGWQDSPLKIITNAKALLLPSHWEGFPNVVIEAMSQSVPVISYDCRTGPRDILEGGAAGVLISQGDEDAFARSMLKLETNESILENYRKKALRRSEDFHVDAIASEYVDLFYELLDKQNVQIK